MSSSKPGECQPFLSRRESILQARSVQFVGIFKCIHLDAPTCVSRSHSSLMGPELGRADLPRLGAQPSQSSATRDEMPGGPSAFPALWLQQPRPPFCAAKQASDSNNRLAVCAITVHLSVFKTAPATLIQLHCPSDLSSPHFSQTPSASHLPVYSLSLAHHPNLLPAKVLTIALLPFPGAKLHPGPPQSEVDIVSQTVGGSVAESSLPTCLPLGPFLVASGTRWFPGKQTETEISMQEAHWRGFGE